MCKYCLPADGNGDIPEERAVFEQPAGSLFKSELTIGLAIEPEKRRAVQSFGLDGETRDWDVNVPIHFCPFCGRFLL